jgi:hypothetical protein
MAAETNQSGDPTDAGSVSAIYKNEDSTRTDAKDKR